MNHAQIAPEEHFPFIEALAEMDETSAAWYESKAGLVMLRFLDSWMQDVDSVEPLDRWRVRAVRASVEEITSSGPRKMLIGRVLDSLELAKRGHMSIVAPRLMAYARSLELDAQWTLAADAYNTLVRHTISVEDESLSIEAHLCLGRCLRMLGMWQDASLAYAAARRAASVLGDKSSVLRSEVAAANLAIDRGNLPEAEAILSETIKSASSMNLQSVRSVATHDLARVAHLRGKYDRAVRLGYDALVETRDHAARDRVLSDIATSFFELGLRDAARDAHLILAATAQEQYMRWVAAINLLEIAAVDGYEVIFEQYRGELAKAELPVQLEGQYHYHVARGYQSLGKPEASRTYFQRTISLAQIHGLNQLVIEAENGLKEIEDGGAVLVSQLESPTISRDVEEVVEAIGEMRVLAGVSR